MIGRVCSQSINEQPRNCLDLGCVGCMICVVLSPLGVEPVFFPNLGMWCIFGNMANCARSRIKLAYNVQEEVPICFSESTYTSNPCLEWVYFGAAFPCSLFQVYESVLYWEDEAKAKTEGNIGMKLVKEVKEGSPDARIVGTPNPITHTKY
ncbi:hypothetical protein EON65_45035 [archaeon]|nr:MAG: hypothetical protein EON65_45035 [archaeon]